MSVLRAPPEVLAREGLIKWIDQLGSTSAHSLDLQGRGVDDEVIKHLVRWPGLREVEHVDLSFNRIVGGVEMLLAPLRERLVSLNLEGNLSVRRGLAAGLRAAPFEKLSSVRAGYTALTGELGKLEAAELPALRVLDVSGCRAGERSMRQLARARALTHIERLMLRGCKCDDDVVSRLLKRVDVSALEALHLGERAPSDGALSALVSAFPRLRALGLASDQLSPLDGAPLRVLELSARQLSELPALPELRCLRLGQVAKFPSNFEEVLERVEALTISTRLPRAVLDIIARAPRLRLLDLSGHWQGPGVLRALTEGGLPARLSALGLPRAPLEEQRAFLHSALRLNALSLRVLETPRLLAFLPGLPQLEHLELHIDASDVTTSNALLGSPALDGLETLTVHLSYERATVWRRLLARFGSRLRRAPRRFFDERTDVDYGA